MTWTETWPLVESSCLTTTSFRHLTLENHLTESLLNFKPSSSKCTVLLCHWENFHILYARHYNPFLIINRSWIITVHKVESLQKKLLKKGFLALKEGWKVYKQTNEFVFVSWRLENTWNLNFDIKFQVFLSRQDRKTNSFVWFLEDVADRQFCFEIYWPLEQIFTVDQNN